MAGQKPGGVVEIFGPYDHVEMHSSTCAHCQKISTFSSLRKMHEHVDVCRICMKLVCDACAGKPCRPWEKEMERQESRHRFLRDMGLIKCFVPLVLTGLGSGVLSILTGP